MPLVDHGGALLLITAGAQSERYAFMIERNERPGFLMDNRQQMPPPPEIVTLALDERARCLPCLAQKLRLLLSNPSEFRDRIRAGNLQPCPCWSYQRHAAVRRMHREVDILDRLARHQNRNLSQLDRLGHQ